METRKKNKELRETKRNEQGIQRKGRPCPESYSSLFWGYYEYDGELRDSKYCPEVDVKNNKRTKNFISKWVEKHLDGLRFKADSNKNSHRMRVK